jgi:type VI secretion system protein VasJ
VSEAARSPDHGPYGAQDIERRIAPLLVPLVPTPCGTDARFEPAHEDVRAEVAKLESPGAPPVSWRRVSLRGGELLSSTSKDFVIACYVAHALYEDEGIGGLAVALTLINELMERFWEPMFPPPSRMRARSAALGWWVQKTSAGLESRSSQTPASSEELLAIVEAQASRLASGVRERMGDAAPAIAPLRNAIERLRLAAPAAGPAAPVPSAAPAVERAPAPVEPPAAAIAAVDPAPRAATAQTPVDLDALLDSRAAEWLAPIKPSAPAGDDARYDEGYGRIREAIKRVDMPTGQPVDWPLVLRDGSALLLTRSKDLLIAGYVAYALLETKKLDGLITGLSVVDGLLTRYWEGLYPDQTRGTRGRGGALAWLLSRLDRLSDYPLAKDEVGLLPELERAVRRLEASADKLGENRPAFGPLNAALTRLGLAAELLARHAAPAQASARVAAAPVAKPAAPAPAVPAPAVPAKPATVAAPVPRDTGPAPAVSNAAELNVFFSRLRGQLWDLANALRAASHRDPLAYRLSRVASYLTLVDPLEHQNKVTALAPPSPFIVGEISALAEQKQWDKVLEIAEGSLRKSMYLLDLHRHVHAALGCLGESYRAAQAAVEGELASLIRRVPELPDLKFQDGTPFADELTRSFLSGLGRGTGTTSSAHADARDDPPREELEAASGLIAAGNTDQAIDAFHALLARIGQGRDRFRARLVMARACASAGSDALAVALFEGLVADLDRHGLDEWEPALASECLAGYHQLLKSLVARDKEMAQAAAVVYRRLCRVDPKRALSGGLRG